MKSTKNLKKLAGHSMFDESRFAFECGWTNGSEIVESYIREYGKEKAAVKIAGVLASMIVRDEFDLGMHGAMVEAYAGNAHARTDSTR
jgi:hypothetical protein